MFATVKIDKIMTKLEIVNEISLKTGVGRKEVLQIVEGFMDGVKKSLMNGENVYLRGFGSFTLKHRAEKVARNISRNITMIVPAHNIPHFKPSGDFTLDENKRMFLDLEEEAVSNRIAKVKIL